MTVNELTLDNVKMVPSPASLNREKVQEWVGALRSGEYEQCQANLREQTEDGREQFCCLGVLAVLNGWDKSPQTDAQGYFLAQGALGFEPGPEIGSNIQYVGPAGCVSSVWGLNDSAGWSFEQIADLIERDWL